MFIDVLEIDVTTHISQVQSKTDIPVCILDEIESALDDVNIDRFARFIKEYAEKTQFIIISHRKGTMEAADVLYGVAMENKGVSRLMSVKVSDYK